MKFTPENISENLKNVKLNRVKVKKRKLCLQLSLKISLSFQVSPRSRITEFSLLGRIHEIFPILEGWREKANLFLAFAS